ncbi:MAG: hypothetical protein JW950_06050 [Deltaproteobacteria bacterium]|nr:hypothetical protein [Deltaproteobacteria bacterium]
MSRYQVVGIGGTVLFLSLVCASPACAYLDPGAGSMIVQVVIAAIAAVSVSIGVFWKRLKSLFGRGDEDDPGDK